MRKTIQDGWEIRQQSYLECPRNDFYFKLIVRELVDYMNKAEVTHAQVVVSKGKMVLLGKIKYIDEEMGFKVPFNWGEVSTDEDGFLQALREKLAEELDVAVPKVDLKSEHLLRKMREGTFEAILRGYL